MEQSYYLGWRLLRVNLFGPEVIEFISESFWLAFRKYTQMNKELQFAETEEWRLFFISDVNSSLFLFL